MFYTGFLRWTNGSMSSLTICDTVSGAAIDSTISCQKHLIIQAKSSCHRQSSTLLYQRRWSFFFVFHWCSRRRSSETYDSSHNRNETRLHDRMRATIHKRSTVTAIVDSNSQVMVSVCAHRMQKGRKRNVQL